MKLISPKAEQLVFKSLFFDVFSLCIYMLLYLSEEKILYEAQGFVVLILKSCMHVYMKKVMPKLLSTVFPGKPLKFFLLWLGLCGTPAMELCPAHLNYTCN